MKKVLIIVGKLYIGGAERVCRDIGLYADKNKYEIHYLVFGDEVGAYEQELTAAGCRIIHMPPPADGYAAYVRALKELFCREGYAVVHAHTMFNAGWAMKAAKKTGVPVRISHAHSALTVQRRGIKKLYELAMRKMILRNATHLVACGNAAGERLYGAEAYKAGGILILNGIETKKFSFDAGRRVDIRRECGWENAFVIGHVGHLAEVKNQTFLIELMPEIIRQRPEAILLLLGDGPDRKMLEERAGYLNIADKVIFTGNVGNVQDYMSAMDVLAFPSLYEGLPLTLLEAQTNGLPCIISDRIPEDARLTDLVEVLSLSEPDEWAKKLVGAERNAPEKYREIMIQAGMDISGMTEQIFRLYGG